ATNFRKRIASRSCSLRNSALFMVAPFQSTGRAALSNPRPVAGGEVERRRPYEPNSDQVRPFSRTLYGALCFGAASTSTIRGAHCREARTKGQLRNVSRAG